MREIRHREHEGGIAGKWHVAFVSSKTLAALEAAYHEYSSTCQICGAAIDDGEQGCPTPEVH